MMAPRPEGLAHGLPMTFFRLSPAPEQPASHINRSASNPAATSKLTVSSQTRRIRLHPYSPDSPVAGLQLLGDSATGELLLRQLPTLVTPRKRLLSLVSRPYGPPPVPNSLPSRKIHPNPANPGSDCPCPHPTFFKFDTSTNPVYTLSQPHKSEGMRPGGIHPNASPAFRPLQVVARA